MQEREWIILICEAKQLGLTIEEIRAFIQTKKSNEDELIQLEVNFK